MPFSEAACDTEKGLLSRPVTIKMRIMAVSSRFDWTRYLCPRGKAVVSDGDGYTINPRSEYRHIIQPDLVTIEEGMRSPCMVVLGEAGIGKSDVLNTIRATACFMYGAGQVRYHNLALFADAADLSQALFDNSAVHSWLAESSTPFLILDSLDEAQVGIRNIVGLLQRRLGDLPCDRLRLCIACRTAAWPETLSAHLSGLYGEREVSVYEVAALNQQDIRVAAQALAIDPEDFLSEVRNRGVQPLAMNPITLRLLLRLFSSGSGLPESQVELFEQGLALLCEEDRGRRDRGSARPYSAQQLLEVASRIAAFLILTGSTGVHTGTLETPSGRIGVSGFLGGSEGQDASRIEIDDSSVRACLNTGLFTGQGPDLLGFGHKSYAEFLAARYICRSCLTAAQKEALFYISDENPPRLVPQLHETAAWLASMDRAVFDRTITTEPEVLVRSDVTAHPDQAETLVQALLTRINAGHLSYEQRNSIEPFFARLKCPNLPVLLRSVILDDRMSPDARESAIQIAEACESTELAANCAAIAVDASTPRRIRTVAARAVCRLKQPEACAEIKPLAFSGVDEDPDDELRGLALRACWPDFMTPEELFAALQPPRDPHLYGRYSAFLQNAKVVEHLTHEDLPSGLRWAERVPIDDYGQRELTRIAQRIALRAWECMERPGVLPALASLVLSRLRNYTSPFCVNGRSGSSATEGPADTIEQSIASDSERRHLLVEAVVGLPQTPRQASELAVSGPPLVYPDDFPWVLKMACSKTDDEAERWAELARYVADRSRPQHLELWLTARANHELIARVFSFPVSIELNSEDARKRREEYDQRKSLHALRRQPKALDPPPEERVKRVVQECLIVDPAGFPTLLAEMTLKPTSTYYEIPPYDLRESPGWQAATIEVRQQIVQAAARFVQNVPDDYRQFLRSGPEVPCSDLAAPVAFALLLNENPSAFHSLAPDVWKGWSWNLVIRLAGSHWEHDDVKTTVLQTLYQHAPEESRDAVACLIHSERSKALGPFIIPDWEDLLDDGLAGQLLAQLDSQSYHPHVYASVLAWLMRHCHSKAFALAESQLSLGLPEPGPRRGLLIKLAQAAMDAASERFWPRIWALIQADAAWGREWIEDYVDIRDSPHFMTPLSDGQCADLLSWLYLQYPPDGDRRRGGNLSRDDEVRHFRDSLTQHLVARGTHESCAAIRRLRDAYPDWLWLSDLVLRAQTARRIKSWNPPSPTVLRSLLANRRARYVAGPGDLVEVLLESLERLQVKLHDELPARGDLWDRVARDGGFVWRPRDEEYLSDYVARHLRDDLQGRGVVANREVQIRRRSVDANLGGEQGQRTDLLVSAMRPNVCADEQDLFSVIIEVKGCWNIQVGEALRSQLVERYLKDNSCRHGLYLVGWFASPGWDLDDQRQNTCPWASLNEAQEFLATKAAELSGTEEADLVKAFVLNCSLP